MLGIALGVAVLITVLSVMNGFDYQIKTQFFAIAPQVTVFARQETLRDWLPWQHQLESIQGVEAAAPFINGKAMLTHQGVVSGVEMLGIIPEQEQRISELSHSIVSGKYQDLLPGKYHIIIGQKLADNLGLTVGDFVTVFTPQTTTTPIGIVPRFRRFTVSAIFETNSGFGFDNGVAYINFSDAQKLLAGSDALAGLHVKLKNVYSAGIMTHQLQNSLPGGFLVTNWTEQYGAFFQALSMEKTMMFVILLLIVGVAAFNLVSTLVMVVNDKRADIAILRTLGATPLTIMSAFIIQGMIIGLVGTLLGLLGGMVLALNATDIVNAIQHEFHVQFISSSVYFVDYLPSKLEFTDLTRVGLSALLLSLIATLYPAWIAFRTEPAEALRYE